MEDGNKAPHSMGSGQQRNPHPRPFFYVQPPSQPYYMYQHWQMNNPYGHYGLPAGFNFNRPCLNPYQYMQYPGFVFPHAPLYPMDYRRMFEPRFPSPHWDNSSRHQPPPQPPGYRETASSEAQTDPSDAITKLIESLDKMHTTDIRGTERELDSGVVSQSSAIFSLDEDKKSEEQKVTLNSTKNESCCETPTATSSASTIAVYDGDSSHRSLDVLSPQECWSGDIDEELPLDSSSVHEDGPNSDKVEEQVVPIETTKEVADIQTDIAATDQNVPTCDDPQVQEEKSGEVNLEQEVVRQKLKGDSSFQIIKLPFELASEAKGISGLPSQYYYNYLPMQPTHERMSVLSPSLDELSSKDEMFSTDLDDVELFPKHVYGGRRLTDMVCGASQSNEDVEEVWAIGSKRFVCACCGKSLPKGATRNKVHCTKMYVDDGGDTDDEGRYVRGCEQPIRVVVRKHSGPRKTQPLPQRHTKTWSRRGQYKDQQDPKLQDQEGREIGHEPKEKESNESNEQQYRACQDRLGRDELTIPDHSRWAEGVVRRRHTAPLPRQELNQRKVMYHRPRDEDDQPSLLHWDRGSMMRDPPC